MTTLEEEMSAIAFCVGSDHLNDSDLRKRLMGAYRRLNALKALAELDRPATFASCSDLPEEDE